MMTQSRDEGLRPADRPITDCELALVAFDQLMALKDYAPGFSKVGDSDIWGQGLDVAYQDALGGRERRHVSRLSQGLDVDKAFATAFTANCPNLYFARSDEEVAEGFNQERISVRSITDGEGYDTTMFWTFAPYIYSYMSKGMNIDDQTIFAVLYRWASEARGLQRSQTSDDQPQLQVHLKGLEYLNEGNNHIYYLDPDPNHPSRIFTQHEAVELATLLQHFYQ